MEIIKAMLTSVSSDYRVLILLIAFGFGGFLEGMAGFGTAVVIPASMLAGLSYVLAQLGVSYFLGPELAGVAGAICTMGGDYRRGEIFSSS